MLLKRILTTLCIASVLTGCGVSRGASPNGPGQTHSNLQEVKQTIPESKRNLNNQEVAHHLASIADSIKGVNSATVVVLGGYSVVGLDINQHLGRHQTGNIKYAVANALKNDPYGTNALVTSDPDIIQRLKDINADLQKGKPIQGILNQLALIVERLVPDASNDFLGGNAGREQHP
ncbi:MAG TPA: YhcN/YlaJ family sporulation lipoprotein [Sporolactobacillaceae bacterium]|nr:YhcN/YlaJ family sporulation lipoprotein [Sporolactobacillaceae bacterium]